MNRSGLAGWGCLVVSLLFDPTSTFGQDAATPAAAGVAAAGPLAEYVGREDPAYGWKVRRRGTLGTGHYAELTLTSQHWHDVEWKHQLFVYKPAEVRDATRAILFIGGGAWKDELAAPETDGNGALPKEAAMLAAAADKLGTPVAVLLQVPFQPIFDDKLYEDAAIAYTFQRFLETGDSTWPLLFPMVKAAVRAMDCLGEFATKEWKLSPTKFTLTGASKRGWTTWLTSAVDSRVVCLAPMVIDMLNLPEHVRLQMTSWGKMSEQIHDYTDRGIHLMMLTPQGRQLVGMIDPFAYRDRVRQPKFIILGTNDRYWPLESLNLYWKDLSDQKYVVYVPNNGHGLRDFSRVVGTIAAAHRDAAGELTMPKISWEYRDADGGTELIVRSDTAPHGFQAWTAAATTRDFRDALWTPTAVEPVDGVYRFTLPKRDDGLIAVFGEARFDDDVMPYFLSTNVRIVEAK